MSMTDISEYTLGKIAAMTGKGFTVDAVAASLGMETGQVRDIVEAERARQLAEAEALLERQKAATFSRRVQAIRASIAAEKAKAAAAKFDGQAGRMSVSEIIAGVAAQRGVTINDIKSCRRSKRVVLARQEAMYLAYELTEASYPMIGAAFGKDHTTILHGVRQHAKRTRASLASHSQQ